MTAASAPIRLIAVASSEVAFVRSPRYLAEKFADAVDARARDVRDERQFWKAVARTYELAASEMPELQARVALKYCRNLDLWRALPELRRQYRVVLVHSGLQTTLECWLGEFKLDTAFDQIFSAIDHGLTYRDPALYERIARETGCSPGSCAVVESTLAGVDAATAAGQHAYRYGSAFGLRAWLQRRAASRGHEA
jgi:FMN phosphatase YigB (HAD superfamily)